MRLEILHDVSIVAPVVDESELKYRCVNTAERQNVLVNQPIPDRRKLPKDVFCFVEILREVNTKSFEGDLVVAQCPSPNIGSPTGCNWDFSVFLESPKGSNEIREHPGVSGNLHGCGLELCVFREVGKCGLLMAAGTGISCQLKMVAG